MRENRIKAQANRVAHQTAVAQNNGEVVVDETPYKSPRVMAGIKNQQIGPSFVNPPAPVIPPSTDLKELESYTVDPYHLEELQFPPAGPDLMKDWDSQMSHFMSIEAYVGFGQRAKAAAGALGGRSERDNVMLSSNTYQYCGNILMQTPQTIAMSDGQTWGDGTQTLNINGVGPGRNNDIRKRYQVKDSTLASMISQLSESMDAAATGLAKIAGEKIQSAGAKMGAGLIVHPRLGIVYDGPQLREHQFIFSMSPQSEEEVLMMLKIVKTFRYLSAPDSYDDGMLATTNKNGGHAWMMTTPHLFKINFLFKEKNNPAVPNIGFCALTGVQHNYNPSQVWATFRSGAPVEVSLILNFKEFETIDKAKINQGF